MGILKSLFTLGKSFVAQAEDAIDEAQGVRMLEHIFATQKPSWIKRVNPEWIYWRG